MWAGCQSTSLGSSHQIPPSGGCCRFLITVLQHFYICARCAPYILIDLFHLPDFHDSSSHFNQYSPELSSILRSANSLAKSTELRFGLVIFWSLYKRLQQGVNLLERELLEIFEHGRKRGLEHHHFSLFSLAVFSFCSFRCHCRCRRSYAQTLLLPLNKSYSLPISLFGRDDESWFM